MYISSFDRLELENHFVFFSFPIVGFIAAS